MAKRTKKTKTPASPAIDPALRAYYAPPTILPMQKRNRYTRETLEPLIKSSISWAEVCRKVGVLPFTGAQSHIKHMAIKFGIDTSHFLGQGWSKGKKLPGRTDITDYFTNTKKIGSHKLKLRLLKEGIKKPKCEVCKNDKWLGKPIILELDHKNSDHFDNRLENLQIVCPNCHATLTRDRLIEATHAQRMKEAQQKNAEQQQVTTATTQTKPSRQKKQKAVTTPE